ncbi:MAG: site-2 protease family protein [Firmicutes bacterium]|nr:site-2 protease family protein [Bacillota bacterium]
MNAFNLDLESLIYRLPAIILALTIHEYAHGRVAYAFGDPTAKDAGRLSFNPLRHLDIVGTLALIFLGFGWAKPVPVNPYYFQGNRAKKIMWVSWAGPLSNILQALVVAALLCVSLLVFFSFMPNSGAIGMWVIRFLDFLIYINLVLAIFNLIPIPPLDGSKILAGLLPERYMNIVFALERYGFLILVIAMYLGLFSMVISPLVNASYNALMSLVYGVFALLLKLFGI